MYFEEYLILHSLKDFEKKDDEKNENHEKKGSREKSKH